MLHKGCELAKSPFWIARAVIVLCLLTLSLPARSEHFPATILQGDIRLPDANGTVGFAIDGYDRSLGSISTSGDLNNDGINDLVFSSSPSIDETSPRRLYVVFGKSEPFPANMTVADIGFISDTDGIVILGVTIANGSGTSQMTASALPDINGDAIDDLIIGFSSLRSEGAVGNFQAGQSFVLYGRETFPSVINLNFFSEGDGSEGFVLNGINVNDRSGSDVGPAGDINADGKQDFYITAPGATVGDLTSTGSVYLLYGRDSNFPAEVELSSLAEGDGSTGFVIQGSLPTALVGSVTSPLGDVNGDGIDDLAFNHNIHSSFSYQAYVMYGRSTPIPNITTMNELLNGGGSDGFNVPNSGALGTFTGAVSGIFSIGDVNADGLNDMFINKKDALRVLFGRPQNFPAVIDTEDPELFQGNSGFSLVHPNAEVAHVAGGGDVDGDGIDDFIIRLSNNSWNLIYGKTGDFTNDFALLEADHTDASRGSYIEFFYEQDPFYDQVDLIGDINGDGVSDLFLYSHLVYGRSENIDLDEDFNSNSTDNCILHANPQINGFAQPDTDGDGFGNRCDPDVNNDGTVNFLDLALWSQFFGTTNNALYDFNYDSQVNFLDLSIMSDFFFQSPGPSAFAD